MKRYVLAILECTSTNPEDGMESVYTGCTDGMGKDEIAVLDERLLVNLDKQMMNNIINNWELFVNSPEYPFIQRLINVQREKEAT